MLVVLVVVPVCGGLIAWKLYSDYRREAEREANERTVKETWRYIWATTGEDYQGWLSLIGDGVEFQEYHQWLRENGRE
jgi:hypothetical protein